MHRKYNKETSKIQFHLVLINKLLFVLQKKYFVFSGNWNNKNKVYFSILQNYNAKNYSSKFISYSGLNLTTL